MHFVREAHSKDRAWRTFRVIGANGVREIVKHGKTTSHVVNHLRIDLNASRAYSAI